MAQVADMDRLTSGVNLVVTALLGTIIPAAITAITSLWNRDRARAELERERLRAQNDPPPDPL